MIRRVSFRRFTRQLGSLGAAAALLAAAGCKQAPPAVIETPTVDVSTIPGHEALPQDGTPKETPRMLPPEVYIRSYLQLFGGLSPAAAQTAARGRDGSALFDAWNDYLASLGLPDYRVDIPRNPQSNTLMLATFERLGEALCDRAVERDLQMAPPLAQRVIFGFDKPVAAPPPMGQPASVIDQASFASGFDVLHRTFLGYPQVLAPAERLPRFYKLYVDTAASHPTVKGTRLKPDEAGWAAVCYALVRHPEFHLY